LIPPSATLMAIDCTSLGTGFEVRRGQAGRKLYCAGDSSVTAGYCQVLLSYGLAYPFFLGFKVLKLPVSSCQNLRLLVQEFLTW